MRYLLVLLLLLILTGCQSAGRPFTQDMFVPNRPVLLVANQDVKLAPTRFGSDIASHPYLVYWPGVGTTIYITEVFGPGYEPDHAQPYKGHVHLGAYHLRTDWPNIARPHKDGRVRRRYLGDEAREIWRRWVGIGAIDKYPYAHEYKLTGRNSNTYVRFIGRYLHHTGMRGLDWSLGHAAFGSAPDEADVQKLVDEVWG